jgi:hypothetical protein
MNVLRDRKIHKKMQPERKPVRQVHIHPDDFEAHLARVIEKRSGIISLKEPV